MLPDAPDLVLSLEQYLPAESLGHYRKQQNCMRTCVAKYKAPKRMLPMRFELMISRLLSERLGQLGQGSCSTGECW